MPKLIITHPVENVDHWLLPEHKQERSAALVSMGGSSVQDFVAQDGSNAVAVVVEVENADGVLSALASPPAEIKAAMDKHGVRPPFAVYVAK